MIVFVLIWKTSLFLSFKRNADYFDISNPFQCLSLLSFLNHEISGLLAAFLINIFMKH